MRIIRPHTGPAVLAVILAALLVGSCDHDPVGADAFSAAPCELPAIPASYQELEVDRAALGEALADAATRSSAGLESRDHTDDLTSALAQLAGQMAGGSRDGSCRLLGLAVDALDRQNGPVEGPDRASIELVLNLTNATLRAE